MRQGYINHGEPWPLTHHPAALFLHKKVIMETAFLNLQSADEIKTYLDKGYHTHYEPAILKEILISVEQADTEKINWFNQFGDCFRSILMNVYAYRKGCEFGFNSIDFNQYGWFKRPQFLKTEDLKFGNEARYGEYSVIHIGRGESQIWTYALNYAFGTAGGGSALSVYGKQFKTRDLALDAGMAELKKLMTEKLHHSDTSNYKQPVILGTLKDINKYEISRVQLSLF
jgi:hypothetical protein